MKYLNNNLVFFAVSLCLSGCSYRYGTGYFTNDPITPHPPVVVSSDPIPCKEETLEKLEVTNKLDSTNNTITTTAVTSHTHDRSNPCFR